MIFLFYYKLDDNQKGKILNIHIEINHKLMQKITYVDDVL